MYIDTHCHLNFPQYDADRAMVVGNAKKAGVKQFINPGVDLFSSNQAIELARKDPGVIFASVGIHPHDAQHDPDVTDLEKLLSGSPSRSQKPPGRWPKDSFQVNKVVSIGECGLDYHQYIGEQALGKKDKQKRLFDEQLRLALKHDLPVIMHCRDAYEDFFDVLDSLPRAPRGVIHCFSGGLQDLRIAQMRKLFVGIDGNVTYSKHLWSIVPHIPLSMMLLETDAPFLPPEPFRGQRNEPKHISFVAKKIAQLLSIAVEKVEEATTHNANTLFDLSKKIFTDEPLVS